MRSNPTYFTRSIARLAASALLAVALMGVRACDDQIPIGDMDGPLRGDEECVCTFIYAPVCGVDGTTYGNECAADCENVEVAYPGECRGDCVCDFIYAPVCGVDGVTYGNACAAACVGAEIAHEGECTSACVCNEIWAPVCGVNGVTYGNTCEAACAQVEVAAPGECG